MKILVIEDDPAIARVVKRGLEQHHYTVETVEDGTLGLKRAIESTFSLILLDLMLPGTDGWQICTTLRERRDNTPILMLTARGAVEERVRGLEMGADDYLPKPFDFEELLARVRSLLRRDGIHRTRVIKIGDLEIDTAERRVSRGGVPISLTHREYELIEALASHEGQVLTREVIQERVWMDDDTYSNVVDVYIRMLRRKIDDGHEQRLIQTVRGTGYCLRRPDEEGAL